VQQQTENAIQKKNLHLMPHRFIAHMKTHICGNIYTNEMKKKEFVYERE
jgi:hypothetical protein